MMNIRVFGLIGFALLLSACASEIKKADMAANANPSEEIAALERDLNQGYSEQLDVLTAKDMEDAQKWLAEAKSDLASGEKNREVLDDVAYGRAYLQQARGRAEARRGQIGGILENRQLAVDAGARKYGSTQKELTKTDDDLREYSGRFEKISAKKAAELQDRYLEVELNTIQMTNLGGARAKIEAARDAKAYSYAPNALKRADQDFKTAQDRVAANRNNPESFEPAVQTANRSANLLTAIVAATSGGRVDEATATRLVMKDEKIKNLQSKLGDAEAKSADVNRALTAQGRALAAASSVVSMTEALESAREQFSAEEADVYQQGDKLLIRLKSMNFPSGRAEVPKDALPILAKVKSVAEELGPREVMIEGHTDSTGSSQANQSLSKERAEAIAKYFESNGIAGEQIRTEGFGFSKPIASNKSREGRAQNRRVDIVITPGAVNQ